MSEKIVNAIIGAFGGLATIAYGKEILVFVISLMRSYSNSFAFKFKWIKPRECR